MNFTDADEHGTGEIWFLKNKFPKDSIAVHGNIESVYETVTYDSLIINA